MVTNTSFGVFVLSGQGEFSFLPVLALDRDEATALVKATLSHPLESAPHLLLTFSEAELEQMLTHVRNMR